MTPLRTLEMLAQVLRESIEETDQALGIPGSDYSRGFRDCAIGINSLLEEMILKIREREMTDAKR